MKNLKIRQKLILSFGIVLALFFLSILSGLISLNHVKTELMKFYEHPYRVSKAVNIASTNLEGLQKNIFRAISSGNDSVMEEALAAMDDNYAMVSGQLPIIKDNFLGEEEWLTEMSSALRELTPHREHVLELLQAGEKAEAGIYMENYYLPAVEKVNEALEKITAASNNNGTDLMDSTTNAHMITTVLLIAMCLISFAVSIVMCIYITNAITRPVREIEAAANDMAEGHLDISLTYESADELGHMTAAMNTMSRNMNEIIADIGLILSELSQGNFHITSGCLQHYKGNYEPILLSMRLIRDNLNDTLTQISGSAEQVANGSEQVSNNAQALSQGATEQAASIEELAATVAGISEQVAQNTANSRDASQKAVQITEEVSDSNRRMQEMLEAMTDIKQKAGEINGIIKTIEDIAFQTNLLALNAAVEAARAGEAGTGFSIIAAEIRSLADKSSDASHNTSALLKESLHSVENGTRIANETARSLYTVVDGVQEAASNMEQISKASGDQAAYLAVIEKGIEQISSVIQNNSATAQESAAASEELSAQAMMLNGLAGQFRLL